MSNQRSVSIPAEGQGKTYFEQQREALVGEIAMSLEQALANINKLNRSLEAVMTVGNEFSSVEALWSQFENVMGRDDEPSTKDNAKQEGGSGREEGEGDVKMEGS